MTKVGGSGGLSPIRESHIGGVGPSKGRRYTVLTGKENALPMRGLIEGQYRSSRVLDVLGRRFTLGRRSRRRISSLWQQRRTNSPAIALSSLVSGLDREAIKGLKERLGSLTHNEIKDDPAFQALEALCVELAQGEFSSLNEELQSIAQESVVVYCEALSKSIDSYSGSIEGTSSTVDDIASNLMPETGAGVMSLHKLSLLAATFKEVEGDLSSKLSDLHTRVSDLQKDAIADTLAPVLKAIVDYKNQIKVFHDGEFSHEEILEVNRGAAAQYGALRELMQSLPTDGIINAIESFCERSVEGSLEDQLLLVNGLREMVTFMGEKHFPRLRKRLCDVSTTSPMRQLFVKEASELEGGGSPLTKTVLTDRLDEQSSKLTERIEFRLQTQAAVDRVLGKKTPRRLSTFRVDVKPARDGSPKVKVSSPRRGDSMSMETAEYVRNYVDNLLARSSELCHDPRTVESSSSGSLEREVNSLLKNLIEMKSSLEEAESADGLGEDVKSVVKELLEGVTGEITKLETHLKDMAFIKQGLELMSGKRGEIEEKVAAMELTPLDEMNGLAKKILEARTLLQSCEMNQLGYDRMKTSRRGIMAGHTNAFLVFAKSLGARDFALTCLTSGVSATAVKMAADLLFPELKQEEFWEGVEQTARELRSRGFNQAVKGVMHESLAEIHGDDGSRTLSADVKTMIEYAGTVRRGDEMLYTGRIKAAAVGGFQPLSD